MVLKNFCRTFGGQTLHQNVNNLDYGATVVENMTNINLGTIWNTFTARGRDSENTTSLYLGVGSSNTSVNYNTTKIISPITELTVVSTNQVSANGKILKYVDATFRNDTNSVIGINEIAFGFNISSNSKRCGIIIAKKVLANTVNINPGEIYSISYSLVLKQ